MSFAWIWQSKVTHMFRNISVAVCWCGDCQHCRNIPDIEVHRANMGPTWVLFAPDGPYVGPMNFASRDNFCQLGELKSEIKRLLKRFKRSSNWIVVVSSIRSFSAMAISCSNSDCESQMRSSLEVEMCGNYCVSVCWYQTMLKNADSEQVVPTLAPHWEDSTEVLAKLDQPHCGVCDLWTLYTFISQYMAVGIYMYIHIYKYIRSVTVTFNLSFVCKTSQWSICTYNLPISVCICTCE